MSYSQPGSVFSPPRILDGTWSLIDLGDGTVVFVAIDSMTHRGFAHSHMPAHQTQPDIRENRNILLIPNVIFITLPSKLSGLRAPESLMYALTDVLRSSTSTLSVYLSEMRLWRPARLARHFFYLVI